MYTIVRNELNAHFQRFFIVLFYGGAQKQNYSGTL